jgi:hypothetical protein
LGLFLRVGALLPRDEKFILKTKHEGIVFIGKQECNKNNQEQYIQNASTKM